MSPNEPLIKVCSRSFSRHQILRRELLDVFPNAVFNDAGTTFDADTLVAYLEGADAAIVGLEPVDSNVLDALPSIRAVAKYGVGLDNVDTDACAARDVTVGWTGGVNALGVAEMTVSILGGLMRNVLFSGVGLKQGQWTKSGGRQLTGRTIGIVGVGFVGKEVIRLLAPYNCRLLVNDIVDQSNYYTEHGLIFASKQEICREADIVTIHTPLTDKTANMVNAQFFSAMKKDAYFVNIARGGIVDQSALKVALKSGEIAGASIDVFDTEPCEDVELLSLPNLFPTPHIGGSAEESILAMGRSAIYHLSSFFERK